MAKAMAARVGDMTAHKTPLGPGPGSSNVFIGGLPAWRATIDSHICPQADGPQKPHVGGKVVKGSKTVFINTFPAARKDDMVIEAGTSNAIDVGCPTVFIGD